MARTKKETRDEAIKRAEEMSAQAWAAQFILRAVLRGDASDFERTSEELYTGARYRVRAWGLGRMDGGYVMIEYAEQGEDFNKSIPMTASVLQWTAKIEQTSASFSAVLKSLAGSLYATMVEAAKKTG